jgi:putative iron-regulated protein
VNTKLFISSVITASLALACTGKSDSGGASDGTTDPTTGTTSGSDLSAEAVLTYTSIVSASYDDSLTAAQSMDTAIDTFIGAPSEDGMSAARQAWLDSREPYLQTEVYRFYDGPIDNPTDGPEGLINAWPMDEGHIDYVFGDSDAGIVNDPSITIDADTLLAKNEEGGEKNVATGYHALEFLLWGQDFDDDGPGERPWNDYALDAPANPNPDRRGAYLGVASDLLVGHLGDMSAAWAAGGGNYRADFEAADASTGLERILTGMIILSGFETGGERLQAALDSGDQEDEHSCFSDNTHRDMVQDVVGVQNVWRGSYTRLDGSVVSGTSIRDAVAEQDSDLADRVDARIDESVTLANALQPPFDQEIDPANADGRARVQALVDSLREQETVLFEVFTLFGLSVTIPE